MSKYFVLFYLENLYYLPHFEPIIKELIKRKLSYCVAIPSNKSRDEINQRKIKIDYCVKNNYKYIVQDLNKLECNYLIFANTLVKTDIRFDKSVNILHACWSSKKVYLQKEYTEFDIRFMNSTFEKLEVAKKYPWYINNMHTVGYSKMDYIKSFKYNREQLLLSYGLDPSKKTILYAPTFYPSSIYGMHQSFPEDVENYNLIIKPHYFIFMRKRYKKELEKIQAWDKYSNTYVGKVEETSIIPFMHISDILISDMSCCIYEFAALNKPVIINRFVKLRWYYKILRYKFNKRYDKANAILWEVGYNAFNYNDMIDAIVDNINNPNRNEKLRLEIVNHVTECDKGNVAEKIVNYLSLLSD